MKYLVSKGKGAVKPFFLVQGGAGTSEVVFDKQRLFTQNRSNLIIAAAQVTLPKCAPRFPWD
jgi:hypothetical protein